MNDNGRNWDGVFGYFRELRYNRARERANRDFNAMQALEEKWWETHEKKTPQANNE